MTSGGFLLFFLLKIELIVCSNLTTIAAIEDTKEEAEHIECRQASREQTDDPEHVVTNIALWTSSLGKQSTQDIIFTPEACQREDTTDRQSTD